MAFSIFFNLTSNSLQHIVNNAQAIEFNRSKLVATTMARSGRVFVAGRNWVRPWRFTIVPQAYYKWADWRQRLEPLINGDRQEIHEINLNNLPWAMGYMGLGTFNSGNNRLNNVTISAVNGNEFTFAGTGAVNDLLRPGDIFQPVGHKYPYVVSQYINSTKKAIVDRGYIQQASYTPTSQQVIVGRGVTWQVVLTKMPTHRILPGQLMEFGGEFEAVEVIE